MSVANFVESCISGNLQVVPLASLLSRSLSFSFFSFSWTSFSSPIAFCPLLLLLHVFSLVRPSQPVRTVDAGRSVRHGQWKFVVEETKIQDVRDSTQVGGLYDETKKKKKRTR